MTKEKKIRCSKQKKRTINTVGGKLTLQPGSLGCQDLLLRQLLLQLGNLSLQGSNLRGVGGGGCEKKTSSQQTAKVRRKQNRKEAQGSYP